MHEIIPSRSLREKQRQEREELILQVTEDVLLEKGYYETSMEEIAMRVGIAKGTLYLHFAKKEDLVFALLERELQNILQIVEQSCATEGTVQARLSLILRSIYQGFFGKRGCLFYLLFNTAELGAAMKEQHSNAMRQIAQRITALHEEGKACGELDPTLPTKIMLTTFLSILSPRAYKFLVMDEQISPEDLICYVEHIYFRGITMHGRATSD